jgi:hypothetical protein
MIKIPFSEPKQLAVTKTRFKGEGEFHARACKQVLRPPLQGASFGASAVEQR